MEPVVGGVATAASGAIVLGVAGQLLAVSTASFAPLMLKHGDFHNLLVAVFGAGLF